MDGFNVETFEIELAELTDEFVALDELQQLPKPLPDADPHLIAACGAVGAACARSLKVMGRGRDLPDADIQQLGNDLAVLGAGQTNEMLALLKDVAGLELKRQGHADRWPAVPLPQCWPRYILFAVCCFGRFFLGDMFFFAATRVGLPVYQSRLRWQLSATYWALAGSIVLHFALRWLWRLFWGGGASLKALCLPEYIVVCF